MTWVCLLWGWGCRGSGDGAGKAARPLSALRTCTPPTCASWTRGHHAVGTCATTTLQLVLLWVQLLLLS